MDYTLQNSNGNELTLINNDLNASLFYTIHKLNTTTLVFEPITGLPTLPTVELTADTSIIYDLVDDNVYKLILDSTPDIEVYFLMDANIKACERNFIRDMLCDTCDGCNKPALAIKIYNVMRFNALKNIIYYFWNTYVQTQSITDVITPPNQDILYLADAITQLNTLCGDCNTEACKNCGNSININSPCGCS